MAIEFTNIAAKRQLISVSEFRPILDIIFVLFSLHVSSGLCKFAVQTSGSLIWIDGCERFLDRKCSKQLLSELEKMALMEDIKLHAGVSFQIE